jgi:chromosome segregation ATPase
MQAGMSNTQVVQGVELFTKMLDLLSDPARTKATLQELREEAMRANEAGTVAEALANNAKAAIEELDKRDAVVVGRENTLAQREAALQSQIAAFKSEQAEHAESVAHLEANVKEFEARRAKLESDHAMAVREMNDKLNGQAAALKRREEDAAKRESDLAAGERKLKDGQADLRRRIVKFREAVE